MKHSGCAKVILLGEHAVVYGHPALAGAIGDGATVESKPGRGRLHIPAWKVELEAVGEDPRPLAQAYRALRWELGVGDVSPVDLQLVFAVPTGAGLGSSAAMAVAVARALVAAHRLDVPRERLAQAAMASETVIHGTPSGLDHTVALHGGFGVFRRAAGFEPLRAPAPLKLVVAHTGRARDTKGRVARVAELREERSSEVEARFSAIAGLVASGRDAVLRRDLGALGAAMAENQSHLEALEVSCPEIEHLCRVATGAGAVGAKLTGGGGGGCVIALAPGREVEVARAVERAGFQPFVVEVGA